MEKAVLSKELMNALKVIGEECKKHHGLECEGCPFESASLTCGFVDVSPKDLVGLFEVQEV